MLSKITQQSVLVKVVFIVVLTNTLILSFVGIWEYSAVRREMEKELKNLAQSLTDRLSIGLVKIVWEYDEILANDILVSEMKEPAIIGILVFEEGEPKPLYHTWRSDDGSLAAAPPPNLPKNLLALERPILRKGTVIGSVRVFLTDHHHREAIRTELWLITLGTMFQALLLIVLLTVLIRRIVLQPISDLQNGIIRIQEGELDYALQVQSDDEIGKMAQAFNIMGQRLKKREAEVLESEKKFRNLVESTSDWIWELNAGEYCVYNSPQVVAILGYRPADMAGRKFSEFLEPEEISRIRKIFQEHLATGHDINQLRIRCRHRDGSTKTIEVNGRAIMDPAGRVWGYRGVSRDITERKHIEEERARLESQLSQTQKIEAVGRLAGGIAHDLNNLLTPILGYSQLLIENPKADASQVVKTKEIFKAGTKARDLVHQLLAFSRKQTLEYKTLDLNNVLSDFESLLRRTLREDIDLRIIQSDSLKPIMVDKSQMEQVLLNLTVNAADSMPNGGVLTIETSQVELDLNYAAKHPSIKPGHYTLLAFSDTGVGMDEETQQQIFEPFFSTKGEQGTGLGLATVYGIVKQHNGNIWVYSELEKGTTFKIYLPATDETDIQMFSEQENNVVLDGSETILVVEDNVHVLEITTEILHNFGYTVLKAQNGNQALEVLSNSTNPIHLLLTDVIMPKMNGRELAEKALDIFPDIKVLYCSGYTSNIIAHHGVLDKGVSFVQKPFHQKALGTKIRELLD